MTTEELFQVIWFLRQRGIDPNSLNWEDAMKTYRRLSEKSLQTGLATHLSRYRIICHNCNNLTYAKRKCDSCGRLLVYR